MDSIEAEVANVLQREYGDATQTPLDRQAARAVVVRLRELGWASPNEVALIVEAAGGSVTVTDDAVWAIEMGRSDKVLLRERLPAAFATRLRVRAAR